MCEKEVGDYRRSGGTHQNLFGKSPCSFPPDHYYRPCFSNPSQLVPSHMKTSSLFQLLSLVFATSALADVVLPSVLSSGMVLQRDKPIPVWGKAAAGEKIMVSFSGQSLETTATADGTWMVKLLPLAANATAQTLTIQGSNKIELSDILIGEVWLGSGQSNMQWPLTKAANGAAEVSAANFPQIRLFNVPNVSKPTPQPTCDASWKACSPETIAGFSAVLYYMGLELHKNLNVPIGLINSSWGGSRIEPWTPVEGFALHPSQRDNLRSVRAGMPGTDEYKNSTLAWIANVEQWAREARKAAEAKTAPAPIPDQPGPPAQGFQGIVGLYNAMIHPLVPFALRGAIWYQGESNMGEGMTYLDRKRALIGGWRKVWNQGDFPFYTVQLAPFNYGNQPREIARTNTALPEIWEAQSATVTEIPNTGIAVTNDIGDFADIHPTNKKEVGRRLSLIALAREYGKNDLVFSGPLFSTAKVEGGKIRVSFTSIGGGLLSRDGKPLREFQIAGADGIFTDAEAVIEGSDVLVSTRSVPAPTQVRFAWNQIPEPNLMNQEGLPASAFRSR